MMRGPAVFVPIDGDGDAFWPAALQALAAGRAPSRIRFAEASESPDLFGAPEPAPGGRPEAQRVMVGADIRALVDGILLHVSPDRFDLAYRLLWRAQSEPNLAAVATDADVARATMLAKSVHRDMHKMKAFVRFRETAQAEGGTRFVAWFEPQHHIVRRVAPFFVARFSGMRWSILTPRCCAHWDGDALHFTEGARRSDAPGGDALEDVWRTYYDSTFNPARLKVKAMTQHMPKKYWHNLPEATRIAPLIRAAQARSAGMIATAPTEPRRASRPASSMPPEPACGSLASCTRCSLYRHATEAVPGEGPHDAQLMIVGEQPGDAEDLAGRPFVGPAGKLLDAALMRTDIDRAACYLTNAVKHFKFEARGKRRLHKSPSRQEIDQCRWWLDAERARVKPRVILALGVSAVRGLTGIQTTLASVRSRAIALDAAAQMVATVHPAYLLRLTDEAQKRTEWKRFLADLAFAKDLSLADAPAAGESVLAQGEEA